MENNTLKEFNNKVQSKDPIPGGGGVCAEVASLSSSLVTMVTNLTIGKKKYAQYENELLSIKEKSIQLANQLQAGINKDAQAFIPLSKAYSMDKNDPAYESTIEACLKQAANSPFEILSLTTQVIDLCDQVSMIGSKLAISDAATAVMLAHGVLYGAYINVLVNTNLMKDKEYANNLNNKANNLVEEYSKKSLSVYETIKGRIING